jgi:crotonobetainyl-CoA:carnitine CoA-transferase CaiB-like acyl-CoA transferase
LPPRNPARRYQRRVRTADLHRDPYCATLLADMGADVIGSSGRGSAARPLGVTDRVRREGALMQVSRSKRCLTLNPKKTDGRAIVKQLVGAPTWWATPPPTLRLGLDYPTLRQTKTTSSSARSRRSVTAGYSNRVGFDGIARAMSERCICRDARRTLSPLLPVVDFTTAILTAFGTMAALFGRQKTGRGQRWRDRCCVLLNTATPR